MINGLFVLIILALIIVGVEISLIKKNAKEIGRLFLTHNQALVVLVEKEKEKDS